MYNLSRGPWSPGVQVSVALINAAKSMSEEEFIRRKRARDMEMREADDTGVQVRGTTRPGRGSDPLSRRTGCGPVHAAPDGQPSEMGRDAVDKTQNGKCVSFGKGWCNER